MSPPLGPRIVVGDGAASHIVAASTSAWADVVDPSINDLGNVAFQIREETIGSINEVFEST